MTIIVTKLSQEPLIQTDNTRTHVSTILGEIRNILFQDRAVPGETADMALKLIICGTGNDDAIARLLHLAVSDVSSEVRYAAVTNIGFVLCNSTKKITGRERQ